MRRRKEPGKATRQGVEDVANSCLVASVATTSDAQLHQRGRDDGDDVPHESLAPRACCSPAAARSASLADWLKAGRHRAAAHPLGQEGGRQRQHLLEVDTAAAQGGNDDAPQPVDYPVLASWCISTARRTFHSDRFRYST